MNGMDAKIEIGLRRTCHEPNDRQPPTHNDLEQGSEKPEYEQIRQPSIDRFQIDVVLDKLCLCRLSKRPAQKHQKGATRDEWKGNHHANAGGFLRAEHKQFAPMERIKQPAYDPNPTENDNRMDDPAFWIQIDYHE